MNKKYVWYACYGSNLLQERFMYYIKGGECTLNGTSYSGCTDKSDPVDVKPVTIHHKLYFGNKSATWEGGGVAFLDPERDENACTLGRMYLISEEQFLEVQEQEGEWYEKAIYLVKMEDIEIWTFTHSSMYSKNLPGPKYKEVIKRGLRETYPDMTQEEIDIYLDI